jgi:hypothetical protein
MNNIADTAPVTVDGLLSLAREALDEVDVKDAVLMTVAGIYIRLAERLALDPDTVMGIADAAVVLGQVRHLAPTAHDQNSKDLVSRLADISARYPNYRTAA